MVVYFQHRRGVVVFINARGRYTTSPANLTHLFTFSLSLSLFQSQVSSPSPSLNFENFRDFISYDTGYESYSTIHDYKSVPRPPYTTTVFAIIIILDFASGQNFHLPSPIFPFLSSHSHHLLFHLLLRQLQLPFGLRNLVVLMLHVMSKLRSRVVFRIHLLSNQQRICNAIWPHIQIQEKEKQYQSSISVRVRVESETTDYLILVLHCLDTAPLHAPAN